MLITQRMVQEQLTRKRAQLGERLAMGWTVHYYTEIKPGLAETRVHMESQKFNVESAAHRKAEAYVKTLQRRTTGRVVYEVE